jgi:methionine synthase I (cobalamin-dependent)
LLITDGAWGTELQARGLPLGANPDTWNLTHPDRVEEVARAYAEAGSQVVLTNTFRANAVAMKDNAADLDQINRAGVAISRRGAPRSRVFASIGPTGKILMSGEVSAEEVTSAFAAQGRSLAAAGADALLVETMSDIEEARLAVEAARQTGLPVIASFAFDSGKNKDRTMMEEAGAAAVGANCGVGVERAVDLCRRLHAATSLPVWIKPNAGLPTVDSAGLHYATSADFFASHFSALRDAGASFAGACCGSTPDFIRALVRAGNATQP